jgi:hypothetical protein
MNVVTTRDVVAIAANVLVRLLVVLDFRPKTVVAILAIDHHLVGKMTTLK